MTSFANNNGGVQNGYKFILTVVDYFSRYVWARKMKMQTAINVTKALKHIVQQTNTFPKMIQADNGSEFMNETTEWMKDNNIVYIKTLSYTPTSNGLVEHKNRRIREVLREMMIRNNSRNWTNSLQIACDNLNSQRNGTTKQTPSSIWRSGYEIRNEVGSNSSSSTTALSSSTAIGYNAQVTSSNQIVLGTSLESTSIPGSMTCIGTSNFTNINCGGTINMTSTNENLRIGYQSFNANTTGLQNTIYGLYASKSNTSGSQNKSIGLNSSLLNTIGSKNTSIGMGSLYSSLNDNNTGIGYNSGYRHWI